MSLAMPKVIIGSKDTTLVFPMASGEVSCVSRLLYRSSPTKVDQSPQTAMIPLITEFTKGSSVEP